MWQVAGEGGLVGQLGQKAVDARNSRSQVASTSPPDSAIRVRCKAGTPHVPTTMLVRCARAFPAPAPHAVRLLCATTRREVAASHKCFAVAVAAVFAPATPQPARRAPRVAPMARRPADGRRARPAPKSETENMRNS